MARTIRLRRWQRDALDRYTARPGPDFLAVATPGAGKTTFALAAARQELAAAAGRRLVVVAPTQHLKRQWAEAADRLDLHLEADWSAADGGLPADVHGLVTTYQQVATSAVALARLAPGAVVVLDEVHHAGDDRAWGDAVREAFAPAAVRLCLSGTPFRSDTHAIPFVRYDDEGLAVPDADYGYGEALRDGGVVRPVHFPRIDGEMEWIAADGTLASASFADRLDATLAAQRLRTALSVGGEWLPHVLERAHAQLGEVRRTHPDAAGLVIALDQEHARGVAELMRRRLGVQPVLALSEDAGASRRIASFAAGTAPWIVAVRMVSEGVDIPRLRVGVFATTTTTELFFRQAVGRIVRWIRGLGPQPAYMFIPDDLRLRTHALGIAEQRRHALRRAEDPDGAPADPAALDEVPAPPRDEPQLSLFAALSATPVGAPSVHTPEENGLLVADEPADDAPELVLELASAPHLAAPPAPGTSDVSPRERRRLLRDANASAVRLLSRTTGLSHAQVNQELNRLAGVRTVGEATLDQLQRRRDHAERWLQRASAGLRR
ncbi:MAG TPA: DEAD/DEAH box helicase family protein [Miltoncostaeaceae bacterium]|nr:DEAD/DEAH box helicase family protein [Miltoncostaeaceae bacterium]